MKKFIVLFLLLLGMFQPAFAKYVKVEALSDFSTADPPKEWAVKIVSDFTTKDGIYVPAGSILKGDIVNVKDPKRLKRDATFGFKVAEYIDSQTDAATILKRNIIGNYSSLTDVTPGKIIKTGAVTAGNKLVGAYVGPSVALVEGAVKNEEGNRAKSAAISVYESTPLSYVEKGHELEIKKGTVFVMSFKAKDDPEDEYYAEAPDANNESED